LERLIVFLGDVLVALVAALFAGLVAAYVQGDIYWLAGSGLFVFVTTLLAANFFFRKVIASCLNRKARAVCGLLNRILATCSLRPS
jgi:hypothetical protein